MKYVFPLLLLITLLGCQPSEIPSCATLQEFEVRGSSMEPLLMPGDTLVVDANQSCYNLSRGDIVLYDFAGNENSVVKQVKAVPGDNWSLNDSMIIVNGETLVNSEGIPYRINTKGLRMLSLYVTDYPVLESQQYLLLGNDPGGTLDATRFGLVHESDILGKVLIAE